MMRAKPSPDEERWRAALGRLDPMVVRLKLLNYGPGLDTPVLGIVDNAPHPTVRFVEAWLSSLEAAGRRRETRRFWCVLIIALISAIAACIAAYPILFPAA